jgi:hypothetical protein
LGSTGGDDSGAIVPEDLPDLPDQSGG